MATLEEAKLVVKRQFSKYKEKTRTRVAYLGDGRGQATSNIVVPYNPAYVYAREHYDSRKPFVVLNKAVSPQFNLPVVLGYKDDEPQQEQVLDVHYAIFNLKSGASPSFGLKNHHWQHEFGGGDEVFVDPRLLKVGLLRPTDTPSMSATINAFTHYYRGWQRFLQTNTKSLTEYLPTGAYKKWVTIAVDPITNAIVYRPSVPFLDDVTYADIISGLSSNGFENIPPPSGDEIPIGSVLLTSTTTAINWNTAVNNVYPYRLHIGTAQEQLIDRIEALEGYVGYDPNLATLGAQGHTTDEFTFESGTSYSLDSQALTLASRIGTSSVYPNDWNRPALDGSASTIYTTTSPFMQVGIINLITDGNVSSATSQFSYIQFPTPFSASPMVFTTVSQSIITENGGTHKYTIATEISSDLSGASVRWQNFAHPVSAVGGGLAYLQWLALGER